MRYSEGLIIAHACLIIAYILGASLLPPRRDGATLRRSPSQNMVHVVCTCGLGLAVTGFACFFLALIGLLNIPAVLVSLAVFGVAASFCWSESPLRAEYWLSRARALGSSWDAPILGIYYLMLVLAFPAMNLINLGSDPVGYHLAYAADWAGSGRLAVDPFLRGVFYASNFVLLDSIFLLFHAQVFVMFLVWVTGLLTALGIFAAARWVLDEHGIGAAWAALAALFLTLAVVFAPSYFRWLMSAYIDVPIGAFALLATLSIVIGVREHRREWLMVAAVMGGFLIGMKESFLPLVVVFGIALWIAARHLNISRRAAVVLLALLVVTSSPWYVRNWILAGDPIWPVLNLALYHHDGLVTQGEVMSVASDLPNARSPATIMTLPFRAFLAVRSNDFREYGTSALVLVLYVPPAVLLLLLPKRKPVEADALIAVFILCMLVGYWAVSSTLLRYSTLFFPLLAVCLAMTMGLAFMGWRWRSAAVAALAALTMIPTPGTMAYLHQFYLSQYYYLPESYLSDSEYQSSFVDGYNEEEFTAALLERIHERGRVYVLGPRLQYYFRLHGIRSAGDWVGPAGWFRLYSAIDAGMATEFLDDLGVTAVLVDPPARAIGGLDVPLGRQLTSHGYCAVSIPRSTYELYVRCANRSAAISSRSGR